MRTIEVCVGKGQEEGRMKEKGTSKNVSIEVLDGN